MTRVDAIASGKGRGRTAREPRRMSAAQAAVLGLVATGLFLGSWTLLHQSFWGRHQIVDTPVYQGYGDAMRRGELPYRDFPVEYPPGALPAFLAPELTARPGDFGSYGHSFEKWMAGCGFAVVLLTAAALWALRVPAGAAAGALAVVAASPLLLGNVMLSRFDLYPTALTVGALAALLAGLDLLGAVVLAVAVAVKLFPVVALPLGVVWVWRRRGRRAAVLWTGVFVAALAAVFLPFAVLSPGGIGHSFGTQLGRPLQIESLGSAILLALHTVGAVTVGMTTSHGSQNASGTAAAIVGPVTSAVQALVIVAVWIAFARGPATRPRLAAATAAAVTSFVAFGKVLSPQYLIWLVPLVPLVRGRRGVAASGLLGVAFVLTQVEFPDRYWLLALGFRPSVIAVVLLRDLVLAALALLLLDGLARSRSAGAEARQASPSGENTSSIGRPKSRAILKARGRLGSYLPRSSAFTVWRETSSARASSPCDQPRPERSSARRFSIRTSAAP